MSEFRRYLQLTAYTAGIGPHYIGDLCYWNGSKLAFTPYTSWSSSMGSPLAVCVIPTSHALIWGNGKARFMSIYGCDASGNKSTSSETYMAWSTSSSDSPLTNYTRVPTWSNTSAATTSSNTSGFMSSDKFTTGTVNMNDASSYYSQTSNLIPSPYFTDGTFNSDYIRTISGYNNGLTDLDGKTSTATLVAASTSIYTAANAAYKYSDTGIAAGEWYLPALGEASYMLPRYNVINAAINAAGGVALANSDYYWTCTENTSSYSYFVRTYNGSHNVSTKTLKFYVRPYVMLD